MGRTVTFADMLIECAVQDYPCAVCGKQTRMFDVSFECPMCSVECSKKMWKEYMEADPIAWLFSRRAAAITELKQREVENNEPGGESLERIPSNDDRVLEVRCDV